MLIGWSGRVDIDGNVYAFLHSGQAQNVTGYANPTVDELLDAGARHDRRGAAQGAV